MSTVIMHTAAIERRELPVIDRAAIRLGTTLIAWGRRRALRSREFDAADRVRADYAERVRTASALTQQRLLP
ncbi:MAG TPA: hypothetical protein VIJ18_16045 [Microbacteriaceae bacterium]